METEYAWKFHAIDDSDHTRKYITTYSKGISKRQKKILESELGFPFALYKDRELIGAGTIIGIFNNDVVRECTEIEDVTISWS